jgi:signal transduction histidine kinase
MAGGFFSSERDAELLEVPSLIVHLAAGFVTVGLLVGLTEFQTNLPSAVINAVNLLVVVAAEILVGLGKLGRNGGLLLIIGASLLNLLSGVNIWSPSFDGARPAEIAPVQVFADSVVIFSLSMVTGLLVRKRYFLFLGPWALVYLMVHTALFRAPLLVENVYVVGITMIGTGVIVYYSRSFIEEVVAKLTARNRRLRLQTVELDGLRRELSNRNSELEDVMQRSRVFIERGRNIGTVAHNFKTPLATVRTSLTMARAHVSNANTEGALEHLSLADEKLSFVFQMIDRMLLLSRGARRREPELMDLGRLVEAVIAGFEISPVFQKEVRASVHLHTDAAYFGSAFELIQVFQNLVRNSWEAVTARIRSGDLGQGEIDVTVRSEKSRILVVITDNGIGMQLPNDFEDIDSRFFERGKTTKELGSGEGMTYVFDVLRKEGAAIEIRSEPLRGTEITVTFTPDFARAPGGETGGRH